jgi:gluconate:H+ symporter, GntP family
MSPFYTVLLSLFAGILCIVVLTARYGLHPFFALLIACFIVGFGVQLPLADIVKAIKEGFGHIMMSLGFVIVLGTALGIVLERNRSTLVMANVILKTVGKKNTPLALSTTGFIVGLPIFCDSGFIVLNGLNVSLAQKTGTAIIVTTVSLATGLYAVHCILPPHPGVTAAANLIGADFGRLVLIGIIIAIPGMLVGYVWASYAGRNSKAEPVAQENNSETAGEKLPSTIQAFLPVIIPILLITLKSFFNEQVNPSLAQQIVFWLGEPMFALACGLLVALSTSWQLKKRNISKELQEAVEKAGGILVIIGAGGSFGAVLAATNLGKHLSDALPLASLGLLFPFLVTSLLKTAQGSSTVAMITAASITAPLLGTLGLDTPDGKLICVLSMGAGSMMISHANDAYFWVIAKFAGLDVKSMLSVYSLATIFMGLTTLAMVYLLSIIL